jgi:hypothetical protein
MLRPDPHDKALLKRTGDFDENRQGRGSEE